MKLALDDLGCTYANGGTVRRNNEAEAVDLLLETSPNQPVDGELGFKINESGIECVADWHGRAALPNNRFINAVTQRYAYHVVKNKLAEQGFYVDQENIEHGKEIHLVMRRVS